MFSGVGTQDCASIDTKMLYFLGFKMWTDVGGRCIEGQDVVLEGIPACVCVARAKKKRQIPARSAWGGYTRLCIHRHKYVVLLGFKLWTDVGGRCVEGQDAVLEGIRACVCVALAACHSLI